MIYFLITCALNTPFGVFSTEQREDQLIETVSNVRRTVPNSKIIILEGSPLKINLQQERLLLDLSDELFVYSEDAHLQQCYRRWNNEPIHKNLGETWCMHRALDTLKFNDNDIIVKLSGRYRLKENFNFNYVKSKITMAGPHTTAFSEDMCSIKFWYVSKLLYWGGEQQEFMKQAYLNIHNTILDHVSTGKYTDVEHGLYHCIPDEIIEKILPGSLGVVGELAATGETVID